MVHTRTELEGMPMAELRKLGAAVGAKDTRKSELIAEIIAKQAGPKETNDLIDQMHLKQGDVVETYKLRDRILERLGKLRALEQGEG